MPKDKGPKKPKYKVRERRAGPKMSRGRRHFQVGKELREQAESYTEQAETEAEKAGKRKSASSWGSLLGSIGVPLAVLMMSNPATAISYLGMAALAGGGALAGSAAGVAQAKSGGTLGGKARRKDVEVEKFYTEEAAQASKDIKEIDKKTRRQAYKSAATSFVLAGLGAAAKGGAFATHTGTGKFVGGTAIEGAAAGEKGAEIMKTGTMFSKFGEYGKKLSPQAFPKYTAGVEAGTNPWYLEEGRKLASGAGGGKLKSSIGSSLALAFGSGALKYGYGIGRGSTEPQPIEDPTYRPPRY